MLAQKNAHPRDKDIAFYDHLEGKEHVYVIKGKEGHPISVTTLIHEYFPKFDADVVIEKWYAGWQRKPGHKYYGMSKKAIKQQWEDNRIESSTLGTAMHLAIEHFFNGELKQYPQTPEFTMFLKFWQDFQLNFPDFKSYRTEWSVYNDKKNLSGNIDKVMRNSQGELMLIDWKRSKEIKFQSHENPKYKKFGFGPLQCLEDCNFAHYSVQLNVYRWILESFYDQKVVGMYLAVFHPNQDNYLFIPVPDLQAQVKSMVNQLA